MPLAESLPIVGPRCGAQRVRDRGYSWRIVYRIDADAILVLEVYAKKTRQIPQQVIDRCRQRLKGYDAIVKEVSRRSGEKK